jgi:Icc-related predicted phosphoesterase
MKLLALSDIHGSYKNLEKIFKLAKEYDLLVIAGDFSKHGDSESALKIIEELKIIKEKVITVHGNWDNKTVQESLIQNTRFIHGKGVIINNTGFMGLGGSNLTPIKSPVEYTSEEIKDFLSKGLDNIKNCKRKILVSHTPPKGMKDRTFLGIKAGSQEIAEFIFENNINLCICGHIHEASGFQKINNTMIANCSSKKMKNIYEIEFNDTIHINKIKL